ncbi:hypothetical protein [Dielma fastidiosa]|uniref:hypothetical protein n=1 Tax=Dielma fastidiosa TaxID=1034346 RepID=UPI000E521F84|nr:hypothetical protein [Dielma fastidiosa]RHN02749.1 hypothetical protein DWZ33_01350 [Dielma fastidiosa]
MFKKILSFLFEEDDEVVVDDDLEKVDFSRVQNEEFSSIVNSEKRVDQLRPQPRPQTQPLSRPIEVESEPVTRTQTIDIKLEPEKKEPVRPQREVQKTVKKEFEFSPVISPMFGSSEVKKPKRPAPIVETGSAKKRNALGTVISPMYGQSELDRFESEAQIELQEKEKRQESAPIIEEVEEGLSLDDLIVNESENSLDDCVQFSLFGDETPLSNIELENADKKEEKEA